MGASVGPQRTSRAARWIAGATALGGLGLVVACLEATQIEGIVSSDSTICASQAPTKPKARYSIRVRHLDAADPSDFRQNDGEFERCDASQGSAFLGNFTLVPESSDGRDHLELVQLMVHTTNGNPDDCSDLDAAGRAKPMPAECIVLRRRVRFVAHKGQRVPMYLDDRCLGKSCEEDSTCFRGVCMSANTTCDATGCVPAHERALAPGDLGGRDPSRVSLPPGAVGIDDAGNIRFSDGAITSVDGAVNATDSAASADDDAAADAATGDATLPPDDGGATAKDSGGGASEGGTIGDGSVVANCSLCGALKCCSTSPNPPFTCRLACLGGTEDECIKLLRSTPGARVCFQPAPPIE